MSRAARRSGGGGRLACTVGFALSLLAVPPVEGQSGTVCPEGRTVSGDLGITGFQCQGRSCAVGLLDERGRLFHDFSIEPRIAGVVPDGPAARAGVRSGDVIVAVDSVPITTREGGRRLADLVVGRPVLLRLRRGAVVREVVVVPARGCNLPTLEVHIF